jgi:KDO2-lipid IV(A) lauroyltransferase
MFINTIPRKTAMSFFKTLGWLGFHLVQSEKNKTIRHLKLVFKDKYSETEIRNMAKEVFLNLARNMTDAFRISTLNSTSIDKIVQAKGLEKIDNALKKNKGIIAITGHAGNWELLGAYLAFKGYPLNVIGAPIYDPRLDEMVVKNRTASGAGYIARGNATKGILRALRNKEMIGILMDQDSTRNEGVFIDFMGFEAFTPVGPVALALKTGAPVLPIMIHIRENDCHQIEVFDEVELTTTGNREKDLVTNTQKCSGVLEQFILKHPTQWVWMHERWKTKREDISKNKN